MLEELKNILWSLPTVFLLTGTGTYFTVKSRLYPIRGCGKIIKHIMGNKKSDGISPIRGLMTALGGTVGVGSITGVAYALAAGGRGALLWLWLSSFFCMMLKYAENYITVKCRPKNGRGSCATLLNGMGKRRWAVFFGFAGILASFGSGNMAQASAVAESGSALGIPKFWIGVAFALLLLPAVFGGQKTIAGINGYIVPAVGILFLCLMCGIVIWNISALPSALISVFKSAFGIDKITGGITGTAISLSLKAGVSSGVFSHEAGMGSSPIAYAASEATPEEAGSFGIIEVFTDTFVVSTLTALALILTDSASAENMFFMYFGKAGNILLGICIFIFAFAAVISWCFYSESLLDFLFSGKRLPLYIYRFLVVTAAFFGCVGGSKIIWQTADIFNALMLFPNLYGVILKRKEISF